ncbi:MAG: GNAT family N-acetyltransferase [Planctomycetota bacterium]|jgi:RimJ/RimL family protein N-acetyltransferase
MVKLTCDEASFRPVDSGSARWLDWDEDFALAQQAWPQDARLSRQEWEQARADGYCYCAIVEDGQVVSIAAEYRFSEEAWMVAAVKTAPPFRRRGYGKEVVSFVTAHILDAGRKATCETRDGNLAMIRTAESVGFRRCE